MEKQNKKQRNQEPRTEYRGIKLQIRYEGILFKYHDRQMSGVIYKSHKRPRIILKRTMESNDYFFNHFDEIKQLINNFPIFSQPYSLIDKKAKIYSAEWIDTIRLFKNIPNQDKIQKLTELAVIFYRLFDEGFYWSGNYYRNLLIDKHNVMRLCDIDSIKPLPANMTFKECYQWYWIIDKT